MALGFEGFKEEKEGGGLARELQAFHWVFFFAFSFVRCYLFVYAVLVSCVSLQSGFLFVRFYFRWSGLPRSTEYCFPRVSPCRSVLPISLARRVYVWLSAFHVAASGEIARN